jgi:hypothetical protein
LDAITSAWEANMAIADYLNIGDRELVGTYTETESVRRRDRPQLARALEACRRLNATLIIASFDGLAHDAQVMSSIFDGIADGGVVFCDPLHSPTGGEGTYFAQQVAAVTVPEAGLISQRERTGWAAVEACGESGGWADAAQQEHDGTTGRGCAVHRRLADQRAADILPVIPGGSGIRYQNAAGHCRCAERTRRPHRARRTMVSDDGQKSAPPQRVRRASGNGGTHAVHRKRFLARRLQREPPSHCDLMRLPLKSSGPFGEARVSMGENGV